MGLHMVMPELTAVAAEASRAVSTDLLRAGADFDTRAGVLCRDITAAGAGPGVPQAACLLHLVSRIVAEDGPDGPPQPAPSPHRHDPMFRMLEQCASAWPAFLDGRIAGVDVIFPRGDREPARYVVSDISPTFLRDARVRFGATGVTYATHDFTRAAHEQELAGERFDVVFGANALHCAADVRTALRHTLDLVAPGGHLVLAEGVPAPVGDLA